MKGLVIVRRRSFESVTAECREIGRESGDGLIEVVASEDIPVAAQTIVVCCDHPDAFRADADRIVNGFPLAEKIVVAGPWLRASGRTRTHWPIAWVISESDAIERLKQLAAGTEPVTPLPATWTREDRWLAEVS